VKICQLCFLDCPKACKNKALLHVSRGTNDMADNRTTWGWALLGSNTSICLRHSLDTVNSGSFWHSSKTQAGVRHCMNHPEPNFKP
jgi:hypothetical protein